MANKKRERRVGSALVLGPREGRFHVREHVIFQTRTIKQTGRLALATAPSTAPYDKTRRDTIRFNDEWGVDALVHRAVARRHGPVRWGLSTALTKSAHGLECPACFAYNQAGEIVAIAGPLRLGKAGG